MARKVKRSLELKSWSTRTRSSRHCVGWGTAAAKMEFAPVPWFGAGIMGKSACALGSIDGSWLLGNGSPVLGSKGQSVGFGSRGAHMSLKFPWRFAIDGTKL